MTTLSYTYPAKALRAGSSLGNRQAFARFDGETNLRGLWCAGDNRWYLGAWVTEILAGGEPLRASETTFSPASQSTLFEGGGVTARKLAVLPFTIPFQKWHDADFPRAIHYEITVTNNSSRSVEIAIRHHLRFPAEPCELFTKQPPEDPSEMIIEPRPGGTAIRTIGRPGEARLLAGDLGAAVHDARSLRTELTFALAPNASEAKCCSLSFGGGGMAEIPPALPPPGRVLAASERWYAGMLSASRLFTSDARINRGLQWAKVNTLRVQHDYRSGAGFTNDPPQDIVVIRDLAWYVLGADYLTPGFSLDLLEYGLRFGIHEGGKLTEYLHADEPRPGQHDYRLNINDDTPLFVYALAHHAFTAHDWASGMRMMGEFAPAIYGACDWIMAQTRDGLVRCDADGAGVWGICGWRNIIDGYNLTGAVTEVNAECAEALRIGAACARHNGDEGRGRKYAAAADALSAAINRKLVSAKTGLYLLNVDESGAEHHDVTGDLIFPVLFGIAGREMRERILERLTRPDMWLPYGSRTVAPGEPHYDPDRAYQLVGGLWHNLTAWIGYCAREERPALLVEAMRNIYRLCETAVPSDYCNVVPGEFPERLHGETFVSRGMAMSPWMPPTYLWLGIEGLLGASTSPEGVAINPALPPGWSWIAVSNLLIAGKGIDLFVHGGVLYSTWRVKSRLPVKTGERFDAACDNPDVFTIGMIVDGERLVFAAADCDAAGRITLPGGGSREVTLRAGEALLLNYGGG